MCDGTVDLDRKELERVESDDEIFANGGMCVVRTKRRTRTTAVYIYKGYWKME